MLYDDDSRNTHLIKLIGERFITRRDVKAVQNDDGSWQPVREPWTTMDFKYHLAGQRSYGHYMLDKEDKCKLFAFDIDVLQPRAARGDDPGETFTFTTDDGESMELNPREVWMGQQTEHPAYKTIRTQLRAMGEGLALAIDRRLGEHGVQVAVCDTGGKGLHVYGFTGERSAGAQILMAEKILGGFGDVFAPRKGNNFWRHTQGYRYLEIEIFPKQESLDGKDLGNLMALPLSVNRKTGRQRDFVSFRGLGYEDGWTPLEQLEALEGDRPWD